MFFLPRSLCVNVIFSCGTLRYFFLPRFSSSSSSHQIACNPMSQSRLRCYRVNLRVVMLSRISLFINFPRATLWNKT
jgi:hypothetical protein